MSDLAVFHVVPSGNLWAVKRRGNAEADRIAPTRDDAVKQAQRFARREAPARIVLHRDDGTIERQLAVDAPLPRSWREWAVSPPVLAGAAGALVVSAVAVLFARRR